MTTQVFKDIQSGTYCWTVEKDGERLATGFNSTRDIASEAAARWVELNSTTSEERIRNAAPELLAALEMMVETPYQNIVEQTASFAAARAAIKKARGE